MRFALLVLLTCLSIGAQAKDTAQDLTYRFQLNDPDAEVGAMIEIDRSALAYLLENTSSSKIRIYQAQKSDADGSERKLVFAGASSSTGADVPISPSTGYATTGDCYEVVYSTSGGIIISRWYCPGLSHANVPTAGGLLHP